MTLETLERMITDCGKKFKQIVDEEEKSMRLESSWDKAETIKGYINDLYITTIDLPGGDDVYINKYSDLYINPKFEGENKPKYEELTEWRGKISKKKDGYYGSPALMVVKVGDEIVAGWYTIEE